MLCILGLATLSALQRCGIGNAVHGEIGIAVHTTVLPCACHAAYTPV